MASLPSFRHDPEQGAEERRGGVGGSGGRLRCRPQEERRLEPLPADRQKRDEHQAGASGLGRDIDPAPQLGGEAAGVAGHPEHHPGDEADCDDRQDSADGLLRLERQPAGAPGEQGAEGK